MKKVLDSLLLLCVVGISFVVSGCQEDQIDVQRTTTIEDMPAGSPTIVIE